MHDLRMRSCSVRLGSKVITYVNQDGWMDISVEPWKKLIIHEVIEYKFDDWVKQIAFSTRTSGGGIPTMQWTNGIVFSPANFPTTNVTIEEQLKGILHWSSVSFAIKDKFEKQIVKENATINLVDVSVNEIFKELAVNLKRQSRYANQEPDGA